MLQKVTVSKFKVITILNILVLNILVDGEGHSFVFSTDPNDYYAVKNSIIHKGYKILDSSLQFLPNNKVTLSESDLELAKKIYLKLEEEEDIVKIYDNIE
jgi:transcriptional/translational regulatory protein YebC/TACO1